MGRDDVCQVPGSSTPRFFAVPGKPDKECSKHSNPTGTGAMATQKKTIEAVRLLTYYDIKLNDIKLKAIAFSCDVLEDQVADLGLGPFPITRGYSADSFHLPLPSH